MDSTEELKDQLVHLAGVAIGGDSERVRSHLLRQSRSILKSDPALAHALRQVAVSASIENGRKAETGLRRATPAWQAGEAPADADSQLGLLRVEDPVTLIHEPVYTASILKALNSLVLEHANPGLLRDVGLTPTRTVMLAGPPGVGKTMAARWIAMRLGLPLLILDLGTVMSRFLGATGTNLKKALAFAKSRQCVLLLDELDAVAKRRDDITDVGELKRLVTVLLQELDDWPAGSLLVGATNHPQLLDPAVWRRFESRLELAPPQEEELRRLLRLAFPAQIKIPALWNALLPSLLAGTSHSEMSQVLIGLRRAQAMDPSLSDEDALQPIIADRLSSLDDMQRREVAISLATHTKLSDRYIASTLKVGRDTLRRARKKGAA